MKTVKDFYFNTAMEGAKEMERQRSNNITDLRAVAPELERVLAPCWTVPYVVPALFAVDVLVVAAGNSVETGSGRAAANLRIHVER